MPSPGLATASLSHAELWRVVMRPYLRSALWSARDAYDAGTHLPVAIRAAFRRGHSPWQRDLGELYADFVDARRAGKPDTPAMHYMAFLATAAQFMAEARRSDAWRSVPDDLLATVTADVIDEWESVVSRSIATKLRHSGDPRYQRALAGRQLLPIVIAGYLGAAGMSESRLSDMLDAGIAITKAEFEWTAAGGCVFQPGIWSDHPDTAYAGRATIAADMQPLTRETLPLDSSHAHLLASLVYALRLSPVAVQHAEHLARMRDALVHQLLDVMLVEPDDAFPAPRTRNFMDGWNGVYRWGYKTHGAGVGYGPYAVSGTLALGTWSLLDSPLVEQAYAVLDGCFPLSPAVIDVYDGPPTTRARHPLVAGPGCWTNGMRELLVGLASG